MLTCVNRIRDEKGKIISYILINEHHEYQEVDAMVLKVNMSKYGMKVDNLKLTSNGRILYLENKDIPMTDIRFANFIVEELTKIIENSKYKPFITLHKNIEPDSSRILLFIHMNKNGVTIDCEFLRIVMTSVGDGINFYRQLPKKVIIKNNGTLVDVTIVDLKSSQYDRNRLDKKMIISSLKNDFNYSVDSCIKVFEQATKRK